MRSYWLRSWRILIFEFYRRLSAILRVSSAKMCSRRYRGRAPHWKDCIAAHRSQPTTRPLTVHPRKCHRSPQAEKTLCETDRRRVTNRDRRVAGPGGKHRRDENGAAKYATEGLGTAPRNRNGRCGTGRDRNGRCGTGMRATAAFLATPRATAALFVTRRATAGFLAAHSAMAATVATPLGGIVDCADYGIRLHSGAKKETRAAFSLVDAKSIKVYRSGRWSRRASHRRHPSRPRGRDRRRPCSPPRGRHRARRPSRGPKRRGPDTPAARRSSP